MPSKDTKILQFSQYQKSDRAPFIICADLECIIENVCECKNNPESPSTTKVSEHIPSGFSKSLLSSLKTIENNHDVNKGKDCIKRFYESLGKQAIKIINFKKKKNEAFNKRAAGIK